MRNVLEMLRTSIATGAWARRATRVARAEPCGAAAVLVLISLPGTDCRPRRERAYLAVTSGPVSGILILGGTGMLGHVLCGACRHRHETHATVRAPPVDEVGVP